MMLRYSRLFAKPEVFRALTGLSIQEFEFLLPSFNEAWEDFLKAAFIDGVARRRAFGGGRIPRLKTGRAKLLFILFHLRYTKSFGIRKYRTFSSGSARSRPTFGSTD